MTPVSIADVEPLLENASSEEVVRKLVDKLDAQGDYHQLFQALLLQQRLKMNQPLAIVGFSEDIEEGKRKEYEEAIRVAGRTVGQRWLDKEQISPAWLYYRMIGETEPVAAALEKYAGNSESDDFSRVLEIAIQEGANPARGFELVLQHYGTCNAITTLGQAYGWPKDARLRSITKLVRKLYEELHDRVASHAKEILSDPDVVTLSLAEIVRKEPRLFAEDNYHIDISHLQSTVQYALELPPGDDAKKVVELCEYGARLGSRLQPGGEVPFANGFTDYLAFFKTLTGAETEEGIAHFHKLADEALETPEVTAPGEVCVHLLHSLGRSEEALKDYQKYLAAARSEQLACPNPVLLARASNSYGPLAEIWRDRQDVVRFVEAKLSMVVR